MRSNPEDFEMVSPASLNAALALLASEPGEWTPIAGGTELMVQLSAGRLARQKLLNIWNLEGLRTIAVTEDAVILGAGSTYTDIRKHPVLAAEFPLLVRSAAWTGSIANQNRGTLGGNIVNASPAADSPPALLVYDAQLEIVSSRGTRIVPYSSFHLGYKQMDLHPDELLKSIIFPRCYSSYFQYSRKVGPRNAQAISKIAIAAVGRLEGSIIDDIRIAAASLADTPLRCFGIEDALRGLRLDNAIAIGREAMRDAGCPIDDIRSTAEYRISVAANLIEEFLTTWKATVECQ
jgi:CO/xanthine dehydrogenase FAD-binding subunit